MARFKDPRFGGRSSVNPVTVALEDSDGSVSRYSFTAVSGDATVQFLGGEDLSTNVGSAISVTSGSTVTGPSSDLSGTGRLGMKVTFDATGFRDASYLDVDVETVTDAQLALEPWVPTLGAAEDDLFASDGAGGIKAVSSGTYVAQVAPDGDIAAALAEADGTTPHTVILAADTVYEVSAALLIESFTTLDLNGSTIKLANGANDHVLKTDNADGADNVTIRNGYIDGNRDNQNGDGTHNGLNLIRTNYLTLDGVTVRECDGHGLYVSGRNPDDMTTQTTRPIRFYDVTAEYCTGWGIFTSSTLRDVTYSGVHVEQNTLGGIEIDHSEAIVNSLTAHFNHSDGIFIRNVHSCHFYGLHAVQNQGIGIYVEGMVDSLGSDWVARTNCRNMQVEDHRAAVDTAEVYFAATSFSYGPSNKFRVDGINVVGDMEHFGGGDQRHADWGVYVEDGVDTDVSLTGLIYGDGGLVGTIRLPDASPTASLYVEDHPTGEAGPHVRRRGQVRLGQGPVMLWLPGTADGSGNALNEVSTPSTAAMVPTSSLEVVALVAPDDWTPGTNKTIASIWEFGNRSWRLNLHFPSGGDAWIEFEWADSGGTITKTNGYISPAPTDGLAVFLRATLDISTGDAEVFYGFDGEHWTSIGTATGGASIGAGTGVPLVFGDDNGDGGGNPWVGALGYVQVIADGSEAASCDLTRGLLPWRDPEGNEWTLTGSDSAWMAREP